MTPSTSASWGWGAFAPGKRIACSEERARAICRCVCTRWATTSDVGYRSREEHQMSNDDLLWRLGARVPGGDYRVFKTSFVDGEHASGLKKRFSLIEAVDWVNVIALTAANEVVM